jgi:hypothetical protein
MRLRAKTHSFFISGVEPIIDTGCKTNKNVMPTGHLMQKQFSPGGQKVRIF